MPSSDNREQLAAQLKTMQIIWASLLSGVAMFLVIALVIRSGRGAIFVQKDLFDFSSMLVITGVMVAVLCVLAAFTVPALVVNSQRQAMSAARPDPATGGIEGPTTEAFRLASTYQTQLIIGLALLEGAAFLNLVTFMIEGSPVSLAVAVVMLVLMATRVPVRSGLEGWIEHQQRMLRDESGARRTG